MKRYYLTDKQALSYFQEKASPEFWNKHWEIDDLRKHILSITSEEIFLPWVKKYLPPHSRILEGGCGRGQIVNVLKHQGYNPVGVDFAERTVWKVNEAVPELDIRLGDVRNLPFEDNEFDGYISVGVIEHFWEGFDSILAEMGRVIKPGGFLFISFPYMSPIRKLKARMGFYQRHFSNELEQKLDSFYQFALDIDNVLNELKKVGFVSMQLKSYDGIKGFKDELTWFKPILQPIYDGKILRRIRPLLNIPLKPFASHCALLVLKNEKDHI
ncbi:MAG: class I SAM-dependent methyltransferase [Candidatus Marinimicrobia bacterium]|jgi:SAM-dependent methyltransferase|nr:class I SAM-dependent methyltransferase [Candidatus Neomarinimicrobiota bacterium]|tara:strand:- start:135 stop:944 length:810 start_codon:yes stop_codon:yes gene_type:complete